MRRAGRLHAPEIEALVGTRPQDAPASGVLELRAPRPGMFLPWVAPGDLVAAGAALGEIVVLGRATAVLAPRAAGATGIVVDPATTAPRAVGYGDVLVALDPSLQRAGGATDAGAAAVAGTGPTVGHLVFRAPTSGRFYGRPTPDKPAFVAEGSQLTPGATICLLEVMKTFHRVTYGGPGLPETARVTRVLVKDGDDVNAGDPLLALE